MRRRHLMAAAIVTGLASRAQAAETPVVLELFTSQGCSSCPPADALLGRLARRPNVIALAWHVDYWDHLGWRDPFASRLATARQQSYARQLGDEVFTPALVVNGAKIVIGSDHAAVEAAMRAAGDLPVPLTLGRADDGVSVDIAATSAPLRALRIVYDKEHATAVGAGENQGEKLHEYRIVRTAETLGEWDGAARRFTVQPAGPGQGQVILLQSAGLRVIGAVDLPAG